MDGVETAVVPADMEPDPSIDVEASMEMLFTMLDEGNYDQILAETAAILAENPDLASIHAIRATVLRETGDLDAALDHINRAIELEHDPAEYWYERAIIYNWRGETDQSIESANHCLEHAPEDRNCLVERAYAFLSIEDNKSAKQDFQRVLEMNPDDWDANVELSWHYLWVEQDYEQALAHINKVIELDPFAYFNYYQRGIILREAGDLDEAVDNFRLFVDMSHPDECTECYEEAQSLIDKHTPEIINLALNKPIHASQELLENPVAYAIDGDFDSCWLAGEDAPQDLTIDLEQNIYIRSIQLMITQEELARTVHRILTLDADGAEYELAFIEEVTWDRKVINSFPDEPWEGISNLHIETLEGRGWSGWCEIRVFGQMQ